MDDIPEVIRDRPQSKKQSGNFPLLLSVLGLLVGGGALAYYFVIQRSAPSTPLTTGESLQTTPNASSNSELKTQDNPSSINPADTEVVTATDLLGHLPYEEAAESDLKGLPPDGQIRLRSAAADAFIEMQNKAIAQGISLIPISGFRTIEEQDYLFFRIKEQRLQDPSKRAEVSAPPGYSEHHTGYTVDIGDGKVPSSNLQTSFENTAAFRWLEENAPAYSFELSFPRDNVQGISYEPWHWRFVGDIDSLETFYKARNLASDQPDSSSSQ